MNLSELTMYEACVLHSRAERVLKSIVSSHLEVWKLTRMEWLVLATLGTRDNRHQGLTMTEVAEVLDVTLPQLNALTSKLIAMNYMKQTQSGSDKRIKVLQVTKTGHNAITALEKDMRNAMKEWLKDVELHDINNYMHTLQILGFSDNKSAK